MDSGGAPITQSGALTVIGNSSLLAGSAAITLVNAGNDFAGAVSLVGGNVAITDQSALTLGLLNTGALTATSTGALNLGTGTVAGPLVANSNNGAITQLGALAVAGTSTLDAGAGTITLVNAGNDFAGTVTLTGGNVQIANSSALTLGSLNTGPLTATSTGALNLGSGTVAGSLVANSNNGAISQGGALAVAGASTFNAGSGNITLANAGNDFAGAVTLTGGNVQISDANALTLGALDTGALTATSTGALNLGTGTVVGPLVANSNNGAITQGGALAVAGTGTIDAGTGSITLVNAGNDFAGAVTLTGGNVQITNANALTLGALNTGALTATSTGALNLGSGTVAGPLVANSNNGAITQGGALTVAGASTLDAGAGAITLVNAGNDFAGAVTLTGGNVQISDANALTLGALNTGALTATSTGALNLGSGAVAGPLVANSNGGAISQSGALAVAGASTLDAGSGAITLTNAGNDFQGSVSLTGDNVQIRDANNLTIASLTNGANGSVSLEAGGTLTLAAQALDAGTGNLALTSNGGGLATAGALSGANVALAGRDGIAINDNVTAGNRLTLISSQAGINQDATTVIKAQALSGASFGNVTLTGANEIGVLENFTAADLSLTNRQTLQVSGTVTASNVMFAADNGVVITGAMSAQRTVMKSGRLTVGVNGVGSLAGGLQINGGATLGGTGTVGNTIILSGGTLAPGNSPGTLNVAGNLVMEAGSAYVVETAPLGVSDLIAVAGTATIAPGAVLKVIPAGPLAVGQSYTVLTATGGVTGQFTLDSAMASPFLGLTDIYTANSVRIQFAQVRTFASAALTPNQIETAGGLDSITGASPLLSALLLLPDDIGARAAFSLLSGEIHPAMHTVLVEDSRIPRDAVLERLAEGDAAAGAWIEAVGNWGTSDGGRGVTASLDRDTIGIVGGVDAPIGENARVGLAGAYTSTDVRIPERSSSGEADGYHILAYLGLRTSGFGLRAGVGYSSANLSTERSVAFAGFSDSLAADYNGETLQAFGEFGYQLSLGGGTVEPIAALSYVRIKTDGFAETGGAAALGGEKETQETVNSVAGVRFATAQNGPFRLEGLLGWRHAFDDRVLYRRLSFADGSPFEINGAGLSKDAVLLDMEASLAVSSGVSLSIAYHGALGDRSQDHMVRGAFKVAF